MWKDKKVLVTGSEGMIGKELVEQLEELGANVFKFDIKRNWIPFIGSSTKGPMDVRDIKLVDDIFEHTTPDYVFHLFGIKGNPKMTNEKPVDFMGPMLQGDTNMILMAQKFGVKRFLYTSSIAVENPETDKYPAWAKRTAETLIEAMEIQYPYGTQYCVVRPANVYGRFDDYKNPEKRGMVVASLISKALKNDTLEVWGDGTDIRDFINSKDVARGMIQVMSEMPSTHVNLCSGEEVTIKQLAEIISKETGKKLVFDTSKSKGAKRRVMNRNWKFKPEISLEEGIKEVIKYVGR